VLGQSIETQWRVTQVERPRQLAYETTAPGGGRMTMTQLISDTAAVSKVEFEIDSCRWPASSDDGASTAASPSDPAQGMIEQQPPADVAVDERRRAAELPDAVAVLDLLTVVLGDLVRQPRHQPPRARVELAVGLHVDRHGLGEQPEQVVLPLSGSAVAHPHGQAR
jgi:hypothetical protein